VRVPTLGYLSAIVLGLCIPASGQSVPPGAPIPRSASDFPVMTGPSARSTSSPVPRSQVDPIELQLEAREIPELSKSLQPDIEHVNHGLLPKDTIQKLKKIEKISRQLRSQVSRVDPM